MSEIGIVIPCYNEASRLKKSDFFDALKGNSRLSFCFVNDGSSDNTLEVLSKWSEHFPKQIFVINNLQNKGKGFAVRSGMLHYTNMEDYNLVGFLDADLSTPIDEILLMAELMMKKNDTILVMGSRIKRLGSVVERKLFRHFTGRVFATFVSNILKLPVYDTQCGAKIFKKEIAKKVFSEPFKTDWLFDIEILARIRNTYGKKYVLNKVVEYPLTEWINVTGSKLKLKHFFKVPFQLLLIYKHYNKKKP